MTASYVIDWDLKPIGPFKVGWGILGEDGDVVIEDWVWCPSLPDATAQLSIKLPPMPSHWASIITVNSETVLSFVHRPDGAVVWRGCKASFDELTKWWTAEEVTWASVLAQNVDAHIGDLE